MDLARDETALLLALLQHYQQRILDGLSRHDLTDAGRKQYRLDLRRAETVQMKLEGMRNAA